MKESKINIMQKILPISKVMSVLGVFFTLITVFYVIMIIAYDENSQNDERAASRQDTEVLAILTGLEIDSAKSGVKPDLSEYLEVRKAKKSLFLQYKSIVGDNSERKWYQPTTAKRVKEFIGKTDWDNVSSNLEKLPYYAYMLDKETLKHKANPATDAELFTFAQSPNWQDSLDQHVFERTKAIIAAYHEAMNRNRFIRHIPKERKRQTDIERILFARGQENRYSVDELYSVFDDIQPYEIRQARLKLSETNWHLTPNADRLGSSCLSPTLTPITATTISAKNG